MNALEVRGVGKRYVKYEDTPLLLTRALRLRTRTRRSEHWAIRGVGVDVPSGSSLGVIGRNGSGKSTLLRMLAGVTSPTEGSITARGRVAPLLSVGVGFHPELTGRENVHVNAMILGVTPAELARKFDEIVDFADIEGFLDTPVKFYSSGMFVRLGFAVAVCAQPDVLLVDEVLAVGDLAFQLKCFDRMAEIRRSGTTVVVVSHNLSSVRRMCDRTLVVHDGAVRHDGDTDSAISTYHELLGERREIEGGAADDDDGRAVVGGRARITSVAVLTEGGKPTAHVRAGETVVVRATVALLDDVEHPVVGVAVTSESGVSVYAESSYATRAEPAGAGTELVAEVRFVARLTTGSYTVAVGFRDGTTRLAFSPPQLFYVSGRELARGLVDLDATTTIGPAQPPAPRRRRAR